MEQIEKRWTKDFQSCPPMVKFFIDASRAAECESGTCRNDDIQPFFSIAKEYLRENPEVLEMIRLKQTRILTTHKQSQTPLIQKPTSKEIVEFSSAKNIKPPEQSFEKFFDEEKKFWSILVPNGQPQIHQETPKAIYNTYTFLQNVPLWAHKGRFPLVPEGSLRGHGIRVGYYCDLTVQKMNQKENRMVISPPVAGVGGFLHDLAKQDPEIFQLIMIDGQLTKHQYRIVQRHAEEGADILSELRDNNYFPCDANQFERYLEAVAQHHEKPDGSGYPFGLGLNEISLMGRIAAVCDVFDVMTSGRDYQQKKMPEEAFEELKRCSELPYNKQMTLQRNRKTGEFYDPGSENQFDPEIVKLLMEINPKPTFHK